MALLRDFIFLKKFMLIFDYPQVYTASEFLLLENLQKKKSWEIIDLLWEIRKINWNRNSLGNDKSKLNTIKMNRSISKGLKKILKPSKNLFKKKYYLSDFKYLGDLFNVKPWAISVCYYTNFLSNNNKYGMIIELSREQYAYFNSLMPYNYLDDLIIDQVSLEFLDCREGLQLFELLLLRSSIRLKKSLGEDVTSHSEGLSTLEGIKDWGVD